MYRLFLSLSFLLTASIALAQGPYLVSDPYPADEDQPDEFVIMLNGTEYTSAAVANNDGLLYLRFDLEWHLERWAKRSNRESAQHVGGINPHPFRIYCGRPWRGGEPPDCFVRSRPVK
jgi:hypothetical protein